MARPRKKELEQIEEMVAIGLLPNEIESVLGHDVSKEILDPIYKKHFPEFGQLFDKIVKRMRRQKETNLYPSQLTNRIRQAVKMQMAEMIARELGTVEEILGYTIEQLMAHLESQFKDGMSWKNRKLWHIDHIRPRSSFKSSQMKEAFQLSNIQPLWAKDNLKKNNKWQKPADQE